MGGNDLLKLTEPLKPNQDHESFVEFRMQGGRGVTRWFVKREVQTEQRREQIVFELRRLFPHRCRHRFRRYQIEECLLWI